MPPRSEQSSTCLVWLRCLLMVSATSHLRATKSYFTWSLAPLAMASTAGSALVSHHADKFRGGRSQGLGRAVLREFEKQPSGLHLPPGLVIKRVQGERISRVVWKLTRGLYFHETSGVLAKDTPWTMEFVEPETARETAGRNAVWEAVKAQSSRGSYGGVFEYRTMWVMLNPVVSIVGACCCGTRSCCLLLITTPLLGTTHRRRQSNSRCSRRR